MKKPYQLKGILILHFIVFLLTSCQTLKVDSVIVDEKRLEEFLKRNDQNFIEVIEFLPTEKNPSDLIVSYKTDKESEYKRYEVALVNLRKSYYEKVHSIYHTFRIYEAKALGDFTFISDSMLPVE